MELEKLVAEMAEDAKQKTKSTMWKWYTAELEERGITADMWDEFADILRNDYTVICVEIDMDGIFTAFDDEACPNWEGFDDEDE